MSVASTSWSNHWRGRYRAGKQSRRSLRRQSPVCSEQRRPSVPALERGACPAPTSRRGTAVAIARRSFPTTPEPRYSAISTTSRSGRDRARAGRRMGPPALRTRLGVRRSSAVAPARSVPVGRASISVARCPTGRLQFGATPMGLPAHSPSSATTTAYSMSRERITARTASQPVGPAAATAPALAGRCALAQAPRASATGPSSAVGASRQVP
jgi:hypothetical protein